MLPMAIFEATLVVGATVNVRSPQTYEQDPLMRTIIKVERRKDAKGRTWLYWHWEPGGPIAAADGKAFIDCGYSGRVVET